MGGKDSLEVAEHTLTSVIFFLYLLVEEYKLAANIAVANEKKATSYPDRFVMRNDYFYGRYGKSNNFAGARSSKKAGIWRFIRNGERRRY